MRATTFVLSIAAVLPALVSAGMYPEKGPVKMLQDTIFRKSLKSEVGNLVKSLNVNEVFSPREYRLTYNRLSL